MALFWRKAGSMVGSWLIPWTHRTSPLPRMPCCRAMSSMPGWRRRKLRALIRCGLVLGEGIINVVPVGEPRVHTEAIPPANAVPLSSPEGETAGE